MREGCDVFEILHMFNFTFNGICRSIPTTAAGYTNSSLHIIHILLLCLLGFLNSYPITFGVDFTGMLIALHIQRNRKTPATTPHAKRAVTQAASLGLLSESFMTVDL